jgi:hypothetical protein
VLRFFYHEIQEFGMGLWSDRVRTLALVFWICAAVTVVVWALQPGYVVGWDLNVYKAAMASLQKGHDPYSDAMAIQQVFHAQGPHPPGTPTPFSYVYSPLTLPLVALFGWLPLWLAAGIYWLAYLAATAAVLLVAWWAVEPKERRVFALLIPAAVFFPGMLQNDVLFSGNLAYILYALVAVGAWLGWTRGKWWPFYIAVLIASCFKAPLLSLVAIAPLSARRQWIPAAATGVAGVVLFAMQPHIWPSLFHHYLEAVELQFSYNHDFSSSPAGLTADALYDVIPYQITSAVMYGITTLVFGGILLVLRKRFLAGKIRLRHWVPLVMLGAVLLNPRIMEYDVAPLTVFMTLLWWRFFNAGSTRGRAIVLMSVAFLAANAFAAVTWRPAACVVAVATFFAGSWNLWRESRRHDRGSEEIAAEFANGSPVTLA